MKKRFQIFILLLPILSLTACKSARDLPKEIKLENTIQTETEHHKKEPSQLKEDIEINENFYDFEKATYFLDKTYENTKGNTIVSPLSLNFALGMIAEGASGDTRKVLNFYLNSENYGNYVNEYMNYAEELNKSYETFGEEYSNVFEIANSVWINNKSKINPNYQKTISDIYKSEIDSFDTENPESSAEKINSWVNEKTHKMIPTIVQPDLITRDLQSILVNTIYFESAWNEPWNYYEDYKKDFTDINGNISQISYMTGKANSYYENEKATAFSYRYKNGLQFIGILPKEDEDFNISDLNIEELLKTESYDFTINVEMPRLDFDTNVNTIKDMMIEQGIGIIFNEELSNFDGIIENDILYIDDIIQKCKIELDENGTKAAVATAIFAKDNAMIIEEQNIKEVFLNRPFAFLIYDSECNQIVFIGKVVQI